MDADPPTVREGLDREQAAWKAVQHGESSLAVVAPDGEFRGLVPPSRMLGVLLQAHDEDFARLGGYLASTRTARVAAEEPIPRRLWHRLPWLALGLAGAAASAWLVGLFEGRIADDVRLAFFIPGVVYLADAVGTQTEALVVRGLSVGVPARRALRLEAVTGPALGLLLAAVSLPAIWWVLGDAQVALAVSLSLLAACSVSTLVAAALPALLARHGRDPAFGSGPLATVVQDLLSLAIYFAVAVLVMG
jgi:magnesium transporter